MLWLREEKKKTQNGGPFILALHLLSGAYVFVPFYAVNLQPSAGGTTFQWTSVAEAAVMMTSLTPRGKDVVKTLSPPTP